MRHRKAGVKLHRTTSHRQAMFRNMVTSLFKHDRIRTTDVKAKELRRWADQIITLAKRGDLHARRQVLAIVREKDVVHKLFAEVQDRFGNLNGGYTRIVKIGLRPGDAAPISLIELITPDEITKKSKKKAKPTDKKKAQAEPAAATEKSVSTPPTETQSSAVAQAAALPTEAVEDETRVDDADAPAAAAPDAGEDTTKKE
jgi:large subunit ribosomal protein L17